MLDNYKKPIAIVAVGVPGCGKTTRLKPMAITEGMAYTNRDDIRKELTGDATNHLKEKMVSQLMYERIAAGLKSGQGIIIDATHSKPKDRKAVTDFCRENGAGSVVCMWFDIPLEICRKRNAARDRVVREPALFTMHHRLKINPPSIKEGFDEIIRLND